MDMKLLDLYCCAGGSAEGYNRAGFEVYGVDNVAQPNYPFPFVQADALDTLNILILGNPLLFNNGEKLYLEEILVIHASPPCQAYVDNNISNILNAGLMLCGTMFDLRVIRHRYFEFNIAPPFSPFTCNHWGTVINADFAPVYGRGSKGRRYIEVDENGKRVRKRIGRGKGPPDGLSQREWFLRSMGIDWYMKMKEVTEAIPPAYTEYIGKYLMEYLKKGEPE